jgi:hypothetical protein
VISLEGEMSEKEERNKEKKTKNRFSNGNHRSIFHVV